MLVQRGKAPAAGEWAIPGGSVRLGESLRQAAEREMIEETNVRIEAGEVLWVFDSIHHGAEGRVQFHYVIVDMAADYISGTPRPGSDVKDCRWFLPEEIDSFDINAKTEEFLHSVVQFY